MALNVKPETLASIWSALNDQPRPALAQTELWTAIAREGWVASINLEDGLLLADHRLDRHSLSPSLFAQILGLPWRHVFCRPENRFDDPTGFKSLSSTDAAAVLILIERLGFNIDAEGLCSRLRPELTVASHLTWQGVDALFHHQSQHRSPPLTLSTEVSEWNDTKTQKLTTPLGYRVEYVTGEQGLGLWLTVNAPKFRKRPEPTLTTCAECGASYVKGLPAEDKAHRSTHRRRLAVLKPSPDRKMAEAVAHDPLGAPWVDYLSPQWKHDHMYRRAFAFKRELDYDFSQWARRPSDDPEPVGFLFTDDQNRVVGACGFRPQNDAERPWRLAWIWLCPEARRSGFLARNWERFRQRFGEFDIEPPVSPAMKAFLRNRGEEHLLR